MNTTPRHLVCALWCALLCPIPARADEPPPPPDAAPTPRPRPAPTPSVTPKPQALSPARPKPVQPFIGVPLTSLTYTAEWTALARGRWREGISWDPGVFILQGGDRSMSFTFKLNVGASIDTLIGDDEDRLPLHEALNPNERPIFQQALSIEAFASPAPYTERPTLSLGAFMEVGFLQWPELMAQLDDDASLTRFLISGRLGGSLRVGWSPDPNTRLEIIPRLGLHLIAPAPGRNLGPLVNVTARGIFGLGEPWCLWVEVTQDVLWHPSTRAWLVPMTGVIGVGLWTN